MNLLQLAAITSSLLISYGQLRNWTVIHFKNEDLTPQKKNYNNTW